MQPNGANKNIVDHAIFSNEGPNLIKPDVTSKPNVTPKIYSVTNKKINGTPILKIDTPNRGEVNIIAGTKPIKVLTKAVINKDKIISFNFRGAMNKFVKFLLQISSKNNILKLMLDLKRMS